MTGADLLVQWLQGRGVGFISVLCGNGLDPLLDASRRHGMRIVDTRNEQTASYIADAYARLTGGLGVCAVSSAVGHANAIIGLVNAHFDGAPMLLITGATDQRDRGLANFQEIDHIPIVQSICKVAKWVDRVDHLEASLEHAVSAAISGRPGPVHLTVPLDVLEAETHASVRQVVCQTGTCGIVEPPPGGPGDSAAVNEAARLLAAAQRPVLVVGTGAFHARADSSVEILAETTDAPIVVPIWDRGIIDRPMEQFIGVIGAASGGPELLPDADLLVYVGARIDYRTGYARPPAVKADCRLIRIDVDANEIHQGRAPDVGIVGNPRLILEQMAEAFKSLGGRPCRAWLDEVRERNRIFRGRWTDAPTPPAPPMTGRHVVEALRPFVRDDAIFLVDGGNIGQWAHMLLADRYPAEWLTCGASAVVGWGMGGAMAARLAAPDRPVILLSGDGASTFTIADLESAARQGLPFVMVVADDQAWGIVVSGQTLKHGPEGTCGCKLGPIRYDLLAESLGCYGVRAETPDQIAPAIEKGIRADRPTVVHVPIATGGPADAPSSL
ncbi:MAG: thiamine pyrophosphate-binding protein [Phycisphaerae bacterium]|nr:thiamine pyrophosphate-binding protein [Phycisphaerae bacterium]